MRVFVADASGAIGKRLVPPLISAGHMVAAMTRSPCNVGSLKALGAEPIVCDVYDPAALQEAIAAFAPELVIHQLTDLPDDAAKIPGLAERNERTLHEGTPNLLAAARVAGAPRILAQSIAWELSGERSRPYRDHERAVLNTDGVVIRYGQFYGPGTYYPVEPPPPPRIEVSAAAMRTMAILDAPPGIVEVLE